MISPAGPTRPCAPERGRPELRLHPRSAASPLARARGHLARSLLALLASLGCGPQATAPGDAAPLSGGATPPPRLVVVVAVDQLRPERVEATLPGGLGRLAREGLVFESATLGHGLSETCPGHASLSTGRHPGPIGITGNSVLDPASGRPRYCVEDDAARSGVLGGSSGRSPHAMRATALGDWLEHEQPGARVVSVAGKDRSAITLGGQSPDSVYWFFAPTLGFTSSRYYMPALPPYVEAFNAELAARVPERWEHPGDRVPGRPDDYLAESPAMSRTSGHPVRGEAPAESGDRLYRTPFLDTEVLALARRIVEEEDLGATATDLLWIGLSATDTVGHMYGPESQEAADALARLDADLGGFLDFLESRMPRESLLVALSADHGVLPLPEWLRDTGRATCPEPSGRVLALAIASALEGAVRERFGDPPGGRWIHWAGAQLGIDREALASTGAALPDVVAAIAAAAAAQPSIARAWTPAEIRSAADDPIAALYRASLDPEHLPDLILQVAEGCLVSGFPNGTTHGSPYGYDRRVPLIFWGHGIPSGTRAEPVETVDLAPTLASRLGLDLEASGVGAELDGRDLMQD